MSKRHSVDSPRVNVGHYTTEDALLDLDYLDGTDKVASDQYNRIARHMDTQDERIAALEQQVAAEQQRVVNRQERIAALEAENERLRDTYILASASAWRRIPRPDAIDKVVDAYVRNVAAVEAERDNYQTLLMAHEASDIHEVLAENERLTAERDAWKRRAEWLAQNLYEDDWNGMRTEDFHFSEEAPFTATDKEQRIASIVAASEAAVKEENDA